MTKAELRRALDRANTVLDRPSTSAEQKVDHRTLPRKRQPPRSMPDLPDEHVISQRELLERIPLDRGTIYRMVREGRFPAPIKLTNSRLGWRWSSILAWLDEREQNPLAQRKYFNLNKGHR